MKYINPLLTNRNAKIVVALRNLDCGMPYGMLSAASMNMVTISNIASKEDAHALLELMNMEFPSLLFEATQWNNGCYGANSKVNIIWYNK